MNNSPEVLIYLQKFREYLNNNEDVRSYFLIDGNIDIFLNSVKEISEKNFKRFGRPELTVEQLEFLRQTTSVLNLVNEEENYIFTYKTKKIKFKLKLK